MSNNKSSLTFDYNKIRELTGKLKDNLKNKYDNLREITNEVNTSNVLENLNAQNSILQTTILDDYLNQIENFFGNGVFETDMVVTGTFIGETIEANEIIIRSVNNQSLSSIIQSVNNLNETNLFTNFISLIKSQDLRLNNQTINNSIINNSIIDKSTINNSIINNPIINEGTLNNIYIYGNILSNVNITGQLNVNKQISVGSSSITNGSILELNSTSAGFLPPRMTAQQALAINGGKPPSGLIIYSTTAFGLISSIGWWGYGGSPATWRFLG